MTDAREVIAKAFWPYSFGRYYLAYREWEEISKEDRKIQLEEADSILQALEREGWVVVPKGALDDAHKEGWKAAKLDSATPVIHEVVHTEFSGSRR